MNTTPQILKLVDLFSGTGSFSYSMKKYGIECVYANDMEDSSKEIYDLNMYPHTLTKANINDVNITDIPKHDILTAGFPCQPFSISGKRLGFNDSRSNVFWKLIEILEYHQPKIIILENVKNLLSHDNKNTFKTIKTNLESKGYHLKYQVLNTAIITPIPQNRERIYIVGFLNKDLSDKFNFDFETSNIQKNPVSNYYEPNPNKKYYYKSDCLIYPKLVEAVVSQTKIYQYRRTYVRENKNDNCPTLTACMGSGGHNVPIVLDDIGIRKLTPRECFNLQGFPEAYQLPNISDSKLYKLAGNAITIPIVELILQKLKDIECI